MSKRLEDMTYDELVEHVTQQHHSALLREGGKGLRQSVHSWLWQAIQWDKGQKEKTKTKK